MNHRVYLISGDCKNIGEKYFGSGSKGKKIDLVKGYNDEACNQDCTGFDLDVCPANKQCLVCGGKYKAVADHYENKGWKCYKLTYDAIGMRESDECNCEEYKRKSKDNTIFTSIETGCDYDTYMCVTDTNDPEKKEKFYSGVCGACSDGYDM